MRKFGGSGTFEGDGDHRRMIAQVQDIKASPHHGQKRLVVRERGKIAHHSVIDIDISAGRDIEEKGTYVFDVCEKDDSRYGYQRKKSSGFSAYDCKDTPDQFSSSTESEMMFNRFGDGSGHKKSGPKSRMKFDSSC